MPRLQKTTLFLHPNTPTVQASPSVQPFWFELAQPPITLEWQCVLSDAQSKARARAQL